MQNNPQTTPLDTAKRKRDAAFDAWQKADQHHFQCLVSALSVTGRLCTSDWLAATKDLGLAPDTLVDELDSIPMPDSLNVSISAIHGMLVKALSVYVEGLAASSDYLAAEERLTELLSGAGQVEG